MPPSDSPPPFPSCHIILRVSSFVSFVSCYPQSFHSFSVLSCHPQSLLHFRRVMPLFESPPFSLRSSEGDTYIACYPDYVLCSGLGMMRIECNNSIWLTMEAPPRKASELTCSPYCRAFCENGGSCVAPGECQCQEGFAGERCQTRKCRGLPDVGGDVDISLT